MDNTYLLAYGLMLLVLAAAFIYYNRWHQGVRRICDPFGIAFAEAANHALCGRRCQPACETPEEEGGPVRVLPFERQSPEMQDVLRRGCDAYAKERHQAMQDALQKLVEATRTNNRQYKFYFGVLNEIYRVNLLFYNACVNLGTLADEDDRKEFGLYVDNQDFIRGNIAKRMTREGQRQLAALWDAAGE